MEDARSARAGMRDAKALVSAREGNYRQPMTTEPSNGAVDGSDGTRKQTLRSYSAPHLIRLDTRMTAIGVSVGADAFDGSLLS